jgi:hypothetical protein
MRHALNATRAEGLTASAETTAIGCAVHTRGRAIVVRDGVKSHVSRVGHAQFEFCHDMIDTGLEESPGGLEISI